VKRSLRWLALLIFGCAGIRCLAQAPAESEQDIDLPGIGEAPGVVLSAQPIEVSDPLEPVNRAFFHFNDKMYFWVLKPVSKGYGKVVPQPARLCVKNFFSNLTTPVRLVNCALQAEFEGAWVELERFAINTTVGVAGFGDPARHRWGLQKRDEDFGQTLGRYGLGPSIYINWPVLGPSNVRDTVGYVGDIFLDPVFYLVPQFEYSVGIKAYETVNGTSLRGNDYEDFKDAAIDPYVALRDAYYQYRKHLVRNDAEASARPAGPLPTD
jgi:phospholipid-binding lipoprotein MlaA